MNAIRIALVVAACVLFSSCENDEACQNCPPTPPVNRQLQGSLMFTDDWAGEWNTIVTFLDCNSGKRRLVEDVVHEICADQPVTFGFSELFANCEGIVNGDQLSAACAYTYGIPGCEVDLTFGLELRREGGVISGTGVWTANIRGTCTNPVYSTCETFTVESTRLGAAASACR